MDHRDSQVFGAPAREHILILASGDRVRHMTVRPWMIGLAAGTVGLFAIGYLAATTYLVLRDDLIAASMARQARIQNDYEDRIAGLRAQIDRVTSRQLLDQQTVEQKVDKLLEQQQALAARSDKIDGVGAVETGSTAAPLSFAPQQGANLTGNDNPFEAILQKSGLAASAEGPETPLSRVAFAETESDRADRLFSRMTLSLKAVEQEQLARVQAIAAGASEKASAIEEIMSGTGVDVASAIAPAEDDAIGGPFNEPVSEDPFAQSLDQLDGAIDRLARVRSTALRLPFANPAPGRDVTSRFGNRTDPFFGRPALHAGMDFRFSAGEPIAATGAGKVTSAGWSGGYGNMVEVDHGNGLATRYGHMSKVMVAIGDRIEAGDVVGLAGSTGRSTGTHLHYEVRRHGQAVDPAWFVSAGKKLVSYLR